MMKEYDLYHHGILGQKWGKQNGPPYPLDSDKHSALEKKDNWRKSLNGADNSNKYERHRKEIRKAEKKKIELTEKQKKYIKAGIAVAGTALLAYGAYKIGTSKVLKDYTSLGKKIVNEDDLKVEFHTFVPDSFNPETFKPDGFDITVKDIFIVDPENKLPRGNTAGKLYESLKDINPSNEINHCQQNSLAAALNYLGADVKTKPGIWSTSNGQILDSCFKGDSFHKIKSPNLVFDSSDKAADWIVKRLKPVNGSCGTISSLLAGSDVDAHAIMWCMEDGKIKFSDPWARTANGHRIVADASFYFGTYFSGKQPTISRIDNLELNYDEFWKYFEKR